MESFCLRCFSSFESVFVRGEGCYGRRPLAPPVCVCLAPPLLAGSLPPPPLLRSGHVTQSPGGGSERGGRLAGQDSGSERRSACLGRLGCVVFAAARIKEKTSLVVCARDIGAVGRTPGYVKGESFFSILKIE